MPTRRSLLLAAGLAGTSLVTGLPAPAGAQAPPPKPSGASAPAPVPDAEPIRLALVEGLSGPFANAGESVARNIAFALDRVNARGGVRLTGAGGRVRSHPFELVRMDSKGQVEEAIGQLRLAADRHIAFVLQGNSSAVAAALVDALDKHNARQPDARMLFLNYSAVDPALTNEKCSFWHFRFDAHAGMRMDALADALAQNSRVRRVWLLNQDYAFGRSFAQLAREAIAKRRPDVTIVGDELIPLGRVRDFAPYAARIAAAGADTVVTGNWGSDLTLLVRAAREAGLDAAFYTFYGNSLGAPTAIGDAGVGRVRAVAEWHPNAGVPEADAILADFRRRLADPRDDYFNMRHVVMVEMLAAAIEAADSTDPVRVAQALEGRSHRGAPYAATMRADDHQLLGPLYVTVMERSETVAGRPAPGVRTPGAVPEGGRRVLLDVEGSGFGFRTERFVAAPSGASSAGPVHHCAMRRPT